MGCLCNGTSPFICQYFQLCPCNMLSTYGACLPLLLASSLQGLCTPPYSALELGVQWAYASSCASATGCSRSWTILQTEMRTYQHLVDQKLQQIHQQQQSLSGLTSVSSAAGALPLAPATGPLPFSGYCLKPGTIFSDQLVVGLRGLLGEAEAYYLGLKTKGESLDSILVHPPQLLPFQTATGAAAGRGRGAAGSVVSHGQQQQQQGRSQQQQQQGRGRPSVQQNAQGVRRRGGNTGRQGRGRGQGQRSGRGRGHRQRSGSSQYPGIGDAAVMRQMFGAVLDDADAS